jgi:hypothetical protein
MREIVSGMSNSTKYLFTGSLVAIFTVLIVGSGCTKAGSKTAGAKPSAAVEAKLNAIRDGGEPVTLAELDASYVEPPANENAATLYAEAFAAIVVENPDDRTFREQNQKALAPLHQAAARTQCRYPIDIKKGYNTSMPHLPKIKLCAQLLGQQAVFYVTSGRMDMATECVLDGLRMGRSLESEPMLISQIARERAEQFVSGGVVAALTRGGLSVTNLTRLQSALEEAENGGTGTYARGYAGERCMDVSLFLGPPQDFADALGIVHVSVTASDVQKYRKSSTNEADFTFCMDQLTSLVAAAKLPFPQSIEGISQWEAQATDAHAKGYLISGGTLKNVGSALEASAIRVGQLRAIRTAVALERYRLAHRTLPPDLNALVPDYIAAVPMDTFDGKPLRYKKNSPRGYVIYSIGPDRHDDGGAAPKLDSAEVPKGDLGVDVRR